MSFNNRCICKINKDYSLDEIIEKIENESFFIEQGKENELKHKIEIKDQYKSDSLNFLYGKYGFEMETEAVTPEITPERIIDIGDTIKIPQVISFWIADNGIILFNSLNESYKKKGKSNLSKRFFDSPNIIEQKNFDIEQINYAVDASKLNNMWISSFSGRNSNVKGGTLSGDNVNEDILYNLTEGASKTLTGILYEINNEQIKIKLYKSGTIQLLTKELDVTDPTIFNLLDDFKEYII